MPLVGYTDYFLDPERNPVGNYQRVIFERVREFELSLNGIDEGWEDELLNDPFEFMQRLMESHEPACLLTSLVEERLTALRKAKEYIEYSAAAAILGLSVHQLTQDIEDGLIPVRRESRIKSADLQVLLLRTIGG